MNLKKLFLLCSLVFTTMAFAQQTVKGSVKDSKGKPVAGAAVIVVGTSRTTTTNSDGEYSIEAVAEETLQFSAQGYQNVQRKVGLETTIDVVLALNSEDAKKVGALGVERDANATGYSETTLEGGDDLKGKTAGLTAAGSGMGQTKMTLRGTGSVTGSSQPLIVIDGVPMADLGSGYANAASEINKDDIESVTVLTGGAATALYGSRGGNGVILYTTKSGKGGKTNIDINSSVTFDKIYIYPKLQNEYGGGSDPLGLPVKKINENGNFVGNYTTAQYIVDENWGPKYNNQPYLPWYAFDKKHLPQHYLQYVPWKAPKNDVNTFFRTGISTNNSISVTRSVSGTNLRFSLGNSETIGIVPTTKMQKSNLSFSFTSDLSSKLKAEGGLNYSITNRHNPNYTYSMASDNGGFSNILFGYSQRQLDWRNLQRFYKDPDGNQRTWNRISWSNGSPMYTDNPYWLVNEVTSDDKTHRFFGNIGLTYNFTDELYVIGKIYGDIYALRNTAKTPIGSQSLSSYNKYNTINSGFNYEARLHYNPIFNEKYKELFSVNTFIGTARSDNKYEYAGGYTVGGLIRPNFYAFSNSVEDAKASESYSWTRTNSIYGMASLGYKSTVFLELTGRQDWFSTVSKPIFYPSATLSYVFTNSFKKLPSWLTYGKLRAGWAQVGNDASAYVLKTYPVVNNHFKKEANYTIPNEINNPDLLPEIKETREAGLDLQFFDSRVSLGVSVYDVLSKDLILSLPIDPATGYSYKKVNSGEMSNKGVEITLDVTAIQTENFGWYINGNFTKNTNKLIKLAPGLTKYRVTNDYYGTAYLYAIEGRPFGEIYGADYIKDANGNRIVDSNGLYKRTQDKVSLGNITPDFTAGLTNTLSYGNFSLSFTFDYQHGGKYFNGAYMLGWTAGATKETTANGIRDIVRRDGINQERGLILKGVKEDGTPNDKIITPKQYAETFMFGLDAQSVFDATYLKLRTVSLSYEVPLPETKHIKGLNFTLSGYNLWTGALAWDGMDPETAAYNYGMGDSSLPTTRSFTLSVGLKL